MGKQIWYQLCSSFSLQIQSSADSCISLRNKVDIRTDRTRFPHIQLDHRRIDWLISTSSENGLTW